MGVLDPPIQVGLRLDASMSHATEIAACPDLMIREIVNADGKIVGFMIGSRISVTLREGKRPLSCNRCHKNVCCHTKRIQKWREAHV